MSKKKLCCEYKYNLYIQKNYFLFIVSRLVRSFVYLIINKPNKFIQSKTFHCAFFINIGNIYRKLNNFKRLSRKKNYIDRQIDTLKRVAKIVIIFSRFSRR